jgi:hypothetical protein
VLVTDNMWPQLSADVQAKPLQFWCCQQFRNAVSQAASFILVPPVPIQDIGGKGIVVANTVLTEMKKQMIKIGSIHHFIFKIFVI